MGLAPLGLLRTVRSCVSPGGASAQMLTSHNYRAVQSGSASSSTPVHQSIILVPGDAHAEPFSVMRPEGPVVGPEGGTHHRIVSYRIVSYHRIVSYRRTQGQGRQTERQAVA